MNPNGGDTTLGSTQPTATRQRVILFPLPWQGHITPMLQLGNILHNHGFKIVFLHAELNSPSYANYPHFTYKTIADHVSEINHVPKTPPDPTFIITYLNENCVDSFTGCLNGLLAEPNEPPVACLITDAEYYFTQEVADSLKVPRLVMWACTIASVLVYGDLLFFYEKGYFTFTTKGWVDGSEWLELLPDKFLEEVGDRGRIVKWCPQNEVLAHPSIGCFWTHSGWNSTLEGICEGVPMICAPCAVGQPIIARYVSDVWKIGVLLEDGLERVGIERAIKRVMDDKEGEEIRERLSLVKKDITNSFNEGGSSHQILKKLVDYVSSFNFGSTNLL